MKHKSTMAIIALAAAACAMPASAVDITGAGATFPFPIYSKWAEAYKKETGAGLNYQSIGSGGGIRQIQAKTVDFGATDAPLKGEDLDKHGLVQFPTVLGGVVPVINVPGLQSGDLKLTGEVLADIYRGEIKKWNDPKIVALNKDAKLPDATITPVYRSDSSGTTSIFTTYLSEVSSSWKGSLGVGTTVNWPVGQGGKGNEGVAATVKQVANSIGYVEFAYAKQNNIPYAQLQNKDGQFVRPDDKAFAAAAEGADWNAAPGFGISLTNQAGGAVLADHRRDLHPGAQDPGEARASGGGAEVLRLGLPAGRRDGVRPRLCAAPRQGRRTGSPDLDQGDQGQVGQAALSGEIDVAGPQPRRAFEGEGIWTGKRRFWRKAPLLSVRLPAHARPHSPASMRVSASRATPPP